MELGAFAITPWWFRVLLLYVAVGLSLTLYVERRNAGDSVAAAIGGVITAAAIAPITAIRLLISSFSRKEE